ncbi:MAG: hypothetical protein B7Y51_02730 [Burkholderiales bacterium 28-67-8]|nr:MAG: hypothetical protein B7Y51_02730 [Burkholderiales bacterium 28-67-8]
MNQPLVSCLCVTRNRPRLLDRAVRCFLGQSWSLGELLVVFESDDAATRDYLAGITDSRVRAIEVPVEPKLSLGALRNLSVRLSAGDYVCQWDDDDWYRHDRLETQMSALLASGLPACVLSRWICLDVPRRRGFVGRHRTWEGSIVCRKDAMLPYPELAKKEDTPMIEALQEQGKLLLLDRPEVYVYHFHGGNTWDRAHWVDVVHGARQMKSSEVMQLLDAVEALSLGVPQDDEVAQMIEPTRRTCDRAMQGDKEPVTISRFRFAGQSVRLRVAGAQLSRHMNEAFDQLRVDEPEDSPAALHIEMWDRARTGIGCPGVAYVPDSTTLLDGGIINSYADEEILRYERGHYVTTLDRAGSRLFSCRADGTNLALYERAKPFDMMLARWYYDQGVQQIHVGLVSKDGDGVIFVGASGSGKSTATLACALAGYAYLGDDHNGLELTPVGECIGHSIYNSARITEDHLVRFPQLAPWEIKATSEWDHKSMLLMSRIPIIRTAATTRIRAVVMPRVVGEGPCTWQKASKVQTLIALAPTSLRGPLNAGYSGFSNLADFIPRMPCFRLNIGRHVEDIPACVDSLLAEALP